MFGATVLVPLLTGLNPSVALLAAGIGTLLFHLVTKQMVPVFLGSSFAFIPRDPARGRATGYSWEAIGAGIIGAAVIYLAMSIIVTFVGHDVITRIFPPIVTGPGHHRHRYHAGAGCHRHGRGCLVAGHRDAGRSDRCRDLLPGPVPDAPDPDRCDRRVRRRRDLPGGVHVESRSATPPGSAWPDFTWGLGDIQWARDCVDRADCVRHDDRARRRHPRQRRSRGQELPR